MSNIEDPIVGETTALLGNETHSFTPNTSNSDHGTGHRQPAWYWPWNAQYWAAIPVIFFAGLSIGPAIAMTAPFIKAIFCERGIPKYFPVQSNHHGMMMTWGNDINNNNNNAFQGPGPEGNPQCDSAEYSAAIAKFVGINASLGAVFVTLTVRFWSSLSDRMGRKHIMLVWALGTALSQTMPLLVYYKNLSVYFVLVGGMIDGAAGSVLSLIALTHAYAADVTRPEERTVVFGRMIAGWYAGMGLGAALAGPVVKRFGLINAFWMMPAWIILDILYILLIPESLTVAALKNHRSAHLASSQSHSTLVAVEDTSRDGHRRAQSGQQDPIKDDRNHDDSRIGRFVQSLLPEQLPNRLGGKYSIMKLMLTCFLALLTLIGAAYQVAPYLLYRFHWTGEQLSYIGAVQGLSRLVALTMLLPLIKKLSNRGAIMDPSASIYFDLRVLFIGLVIEAFTLFLYGATTVGEGFYIGGVTGAIGSLFFPAMRGILSQSVAPELLGKTLGTLATFESLSVVIAPSLFAWLYGLTLKTHPSNVFYTAAALALVASFLALSVLLEHRRAMRHYRQ